MTRFRRVMSLLLSLCLVMAILSPAALAAELPEDTDSDNTVSEALPAAPEDLPEGGQQWGEADATGHLFQAGSLTGPQTFPDTPSLFDGDNAWNALYNTILNGLLNKYVKIDISGFWIQCTEENWVGLCECYFTVINDHPELFYITSLEAHDYYSFEYNAWFYLEIAPVYNTSLPNDYQQRFDAAAQKALDQVQPGMGQVEAMLAIHDYLVVNCLYDWNGAIAPGSNTYSPNIFNAYGVLVEQDAVCQGYAEAYKYLMDRLGIPCIICSSEELNHAWNQVFLNGYWYNVDTTWDDPTPNTYGVCHHRNFLRSDAGFRETGHTTYDWTSPYTCYETTFDTSAFPSINYPVRWKDSSMYYVELQKNPQNGYCIGYLVKNPGNGQAPTRLLNYPDPNAGACWVGDCLYYVGWDDTPNCSYWGPVRGIYYYDITSGRQGCAGYFNFIQTGSPDGFYAADYDCPGMRYIPEYNLISIESCTRRASICSLEALNLPDYPASWDSVTGARFIEMLSDGRVGVRTEVSSSVLWIAYYNSNGKMTDLERYNLAGSGIHLVRPKDPDASVSQAKLMLTSSQGKPLCPAYPLDVINPSQRNQGAFPMYFSQNSA